MSMTPLPSTMGTGPDEGVPHPKRTLRRCRQLARRALRVSWLVICVHHSATIADDVNGNLHSLDLSKVSRLGGHSFERTHRGGAQFPGMLGVRPCPAHLHAYHGGTIGQA